MKLTTLDMEIALAEHFNPRANLIVPGVHWGLCIHECDLLVLTKAGYAYEVEIKISKADLIKDKDKKHGHKDSRLKYLYFAIPKYLEAEIEHIPAHAGIILVEKKIGKFHRWSHDEVVEREYFRCNVLRSPETQGNYKFSDKDRYELARLGALRIWTLKKKLNKTP